MATSSSDKVTSSSDKVTSLEDPGVLIVNSIKQDLPGYFLEDDYRYGEMSTEEYSRLKEKWQHAVLKYFLDMDIHTIKKGPKIEDSYKFEYYQNLTLSKWEQWLGGRYEKPLFNSDKELDDLIKSYPQVSSVIDKTSTTYLNWKIRLLNKTGDAKEDEDEEGKDKKKKSFKEQVEICILIKQIKELLFGSNSIPHDGETIHLLIEGKHYGLLLQLSEEPWFEARTKASEDVKASPRNYKDIVYTATKVFDSDMMRKVLPKLINCFGIDGNSIRNLIEHKVLDPRDKREIFTKLVKQFGRDDEIFIPYNLYTDLAYSIKNHDEVLSYVDLCIENGVARNGEAINTFIQATRSTKTVKPLMDRGFALRSLRFLACHSISTSMKIEFLDEIMTLNRFRIEDIDILISEREMDNIIEYILIDWDIKLLNKIRVCEHLFRKMSLYGRLLWIKFFESVNHYKFRNGAAPFHENTSENMIPMLEWLWSYSPLKSDDYDLLRNISYKDDEKDDKDGESKDEVKDGERKNEVKDEESKDGESKDKVKDEESKDEVKRKEERRKIEGKDLKTENRWRREVSMWLKNKDLSIMLYFIDNDFYYERRRFESYTTKLLEDLKHAEKCRVEELKRERRKRRSRDDYFDDYWIDDMDREMRRDDKRRLNELNEEDKKKVLESAKKRIERATENINRRALKWATKEVFNEWNSLLRSAKFEIVGGKISPKQKDTPESKISPKQKDTPESKDTKPRDTYERYTSDSEDELEFKDVYEPKGGSKSEDRTELHNFLVETLKDGKVKDLLKSRWLPVSKEVNRYSRLNFKQAYEEVYEFDYGYSPSENDFNYYNQEKLMFSDFDCLHEREEYNEEDEETKDENDKEENEEDKETKEDKMVLTTETTSMMTKRSKKKLIKTNKKLMRSKKKRIQKTIRMMKKNEA